MDYEFDADTKVAVRGRHPTWSTGVVRERIGKFGPQEEPVYLVQPDGDQWTPEARLVVPQIDISPVTDRPAEETRLGEEEEEETYSIHVESADPNLGEAVAEGAHLIAEALEGGLSPFKVVLNNEAMQPVTSWEKQ